MKIEQFIHGEGKKWHWFLIDTENHNVLVQGYSKSKTKAFSAVNGAQVVFMLGLED